MIPRTSDSLSLTVSKLCHRDSQEAAETASKASRRDSGEAALKRWMVGTPGTPGGRDFEIRGTGGIQEDQEDYDGNKGIMRNAKII